MCTTPTKNCITGSGMEIIGYKVMQNYMFVLQLMLRQPAS